MNYCFYHCVDFDGKASGAIVKKYFKDNDLAIRMVPFNYSYEIDLTQYQFGDRLIFVDVVPQPYDTLLKLQEIVEDRLYVIDHHASFIESDTHKKLSGLIPNTLVTDSRFAACELVWNYYFPTTAIPEAIHLLGQYDSWRDRPSRKHKHDADWENRVLPFQFGLRHKKFVEDDFIKDFLESDNPFEVETVVSTGRTVLEYQDTQNELLMTTSFEAKIKGYNCLCVNSFLKNSRVFKSKFDPDKHDFMVAFSLKSNKKWNFSFYSESEEKDASKLAVLFGGGGHKKAAGCITDALIFDH